MMKFKSGLIKIFLFLTGTFVITNLAFSVGTNNRWYGLELKSFSARSIAMGGVTIIGSTSIADATRNPAQLSAFAKGLQVEGMVELPQTIESRSFPIYDSFGGVLAENQYVSNSMGMAMWGGAASVSLKTEKQNDLRIAIFSLPVIDYEFHFSEEIRDRFSTGGLQDRVRGRVVDRTQGSRQWSGFAFAAQINQRAAIGLSVGMVMGKITDSYTINRILPTDSTATRKTIRETDNAHIHACTGITYNLNPRLTLGWNLTYRGTRNEKISTTTVDTATVNTLSIMNRNFPISTAIAIQFIPGQIYSSKFITEIEWTNWKSASLDISNPARWNTLEIRAGIEHRFLPEVPVRFGYAYSPSPFNKEQSISYFSAGTGYQKQNWIIDFGIQFGHNTSKENDPVPDNLFGGQPRMDQDRVQTRFLKSALTITYLLGSKK